MQTKQNVVSNQKSNNVKRRISLFYIKAKKVLPLLLVFFVMLLIVLKPQTYIASATDGLLLFATNVLPALLPFFFFSGLLTRLGAADILARGFSKPISKLYRTSGASAYVFFMSFLCGYPIGAKLTEELFLSNRIDSSNAKTMSAFCSTSGPIFVIGTVGTIMLNNRNAGIVIFAAHIIAALLNGLLYRGKKTTTSAFLPKEISTDHILAETMASSTASMLAVGGFICIFNVLIDAAINIGVISFLENLVPFIPQNAAQSLFCGMLEMTRGCSMLSFLDTSKILTYSLAAAIISFGGLGVIFQSAAFLSKCNVKMSLVIVQKLTHSLITFLLCFGFLSLFSI